MALNIFQPYIFHELIDAEHDLYKVSNDGILYGVTKGSYNSYATLRVPIKYESLLYYRIDRILAKYRGKYGFVSADTISAFFHNRTPLDYRNDYEIIVPFIFDSITEKGKDLFEVSIKDSLFVMDIEGIIKCNDSDYFEKLLDSIYENANDPCSDNFIPDILKYTKIDDGCYTLQPIEREDLNGNFISARGWYHTYNEGIDEDYDYNTFTYYGVINHEGKIIIPTIFERIEELTGKLEGFYLAKFRDYYSEGKKKKYAEGRGDLYLFTEEGECVLAGFSEIEMEDEETMRVYLKDYEVQSPEETIENGMVELDSHLYIRLNSEFQLKEIPDGLSSFRNTYMELFDSDANPFKPTKEILQRFSLSIISISQYICRLDPERDEKEYLDWNDECNPSIDDSLDAFDGDVEAYNEWRM